MVWLIFGCARSQSLLPTASVSKLNLPELLTPEPVGPLDQTINAFPSKQKKSGSHDQEWQPLAAVRPWKSIVLHHTASASGSVESIDQLHRRRKDSRGKPWLGIGYHFVIGNGQGMPDGAVSPTFRWRDQLAGAHAGDAKLNSTGIGIVLVGNFEKEVPSSSQLRATTTLLKHLTSTYKISSEAILGHGDIKATACPGRYFPLADLRASVAALGTDSELPLARLVPSTGDTRKDALQ